MNSQNIFLSDLQSPYLLKNIRQFFSALKEPTKQLSKSETKVSTSFFTKFLPPYRHQTKNGSNINSSKRLRVSRITKKLSYK